MMDKMVKCMIDRLERSHSTQHVFPLSFVSAGNGWIVVYTMKRDPGSQFSCTRAAFFNDAGECVWDFIC